MRDMKRLFTLIIICGLYILESIMYVNGFPEEHNYYQMDTRNKNLHLPSQQTTQFENNLPTQKKIVNKSPGFF